MQTPKRIGIWQTAFLGDLVLTLPLLQTIHSAWPNAEIHLYTRGGLESLFAGQKELTSVTGFYKRGKQKGLGAAWSFGRSLAEQHFDLWVSPHTSLRSGLIAFASGIPMRVGYASPWYNRMAYTHTIDRRFTELEEIERLMQLTKPLGLNTRAPWPELTLPPHAEAEAKKIIGSLQGPVLGLHPGSTWPTKQWPLEYFAEIAARGVGEGFTVTVFGGPGEEEDAASLIHQAKALGYANPQEYDDRLINLAGQLDLPTLAACIARLDAYLTNDSGPMHLSWIQRTPTVAIFGPTVRELGFFPRGEHSQIVEVDGLSCRPCGLHGPKRCPKEHFHCMRELTTNRVWAAVQHALTN